MQTHLVTGATGLVGSHVAELLAKRGEHVRALVRPGRDTTLLQSLGVELFAGDLNEPASLTEAVSGAHTVYHCAAQVSEWGPWRSFERAIVETTRNLVAACRNTGVERFLHVSSSRVYGHPNGGGAAVTEESPLGQNLWRLWDYYPRAKIVAEELVRQFPGAWSIVRPTWTYGPRDRNTLPRMIDALKRHQAGLVGKGDNPLPLIHASDVAAGIVLAGTSPTAVGQVYNLSATKAVTQREIFDALTDAIGIERLRTGAPYSAAFAIGFAIEVVGKVLRMKRNMRITRHVVTLLARSPVLSSAKALRDLGWEARIPPQEGLREAVAWHFAHGVKASRRRSASAPAGARITR